MSEEPSTLYKLIILYMLDRSEYPLATAKVHEFFLDRDYTNFISLQLAISELIESGLVTAQTVRNRTILTITEDGRSTLEFFVGRISKSIREDIAAYFNENRMQLRKEAAIRSEYYRITGGDYQAVLSVREKGTDLVSVTLTVPTEELAAAVCDSWEKKNGDIYQYLIEQLLQ